MILLEDFLGAPSLTTILLGVAGFVGSILIYRVIKNNDEKIKSIVEANKDEIIRINKHLESTDNKVERLEDLHNTLNINVIEKMNAMEKGILEQINALSLKLEQWRKV